MYVNYCLCRFIAIFFSLSLRIGIKKLLAMVEACLQVYIHIVQAHHIPPSLITFPSLVTSPCSSHPLSLITSSTNTALFSPHSSHPHTSHLSLHHTLSHLTRHNFYLTHHNLSPTHLTLTTDRGSCQVSSFEAATRCSSWSQGE